MDIDLTNLTVVQVFGLLAVIAAVDVFTAIGLSIIHGNFDAGVVAVWYQSHVIKRAFPIAALAILGHGVTVGEQSFIPAIPAAMALALAGLAAYVIETIASLRDSFADTTPPTDTTPANP